jgi:hypothetical protein
VQGERPERDAAIWAIVGKNEVKVKSIDLLREERKEKIESDDKFYYHSKNDLHFLDDNLGEFAFKDLQKPLCLKGVRMLYPFYVHPRMIAQHSFFTIQDNPWSPLGEKYSGGKEDKYIDIAMIYRWRVPGGKRNENRKWDIVNELERLGINNRTLYPDLDGLAKGLWQLETIRKYNPRQFNLIKDK